MRFSSESIENYLLSNIQQEIAATRDEHKIIMQQINDLKQLISQIGSAGISPALESQILQAKSLVDGIKPQ